MLDARLLWFFVCMLRIGTSTRWCMLGMFFTIGRFAYGRFDLMHRVYAGVIVSARNVAKVDRAPIRHFTTKSVVWDIIDGRYPQYVGAVRSASIDQ